MCKHGSYLFGVKKIAYALFCLTFFWQECGVCEQLMDPTRPPGLVLPGETAGTKSAPQWVLSSTLIAPTRRVATLNGQSVQVGEQINGAQVIRIEPARVVLRKDRQEVVVELSSYDFKRMR